MVDRLPLPLRIASGMSLAHTAPIPKAAQHSVVSDAAAPPASTTAAAEHAIVMAAGTAAVGTEHAAEQRGNGSAVAVWANSAANENLRPAGSQPGLAGPAATDQAVQTTSEAVGVGSCSAQAQERWENTLSTAARLGGAPTSARPHGDAALSALPPNTGTMLQHSSASTTCQQADGLLPSATLEGNTALNAAHRRSLLTSTLKQSLAVRGGAPRPPSYDMSEDGDRRPSYDISQASCSSPRVSYAASSSHHGVSPNSSSAPIPPFPGSARRISCAVR